MGRERKRGMEHVYGISHRGVPEGEGKAECQIEEEVITSTKEFIFKYLSILERMLGAEISFLCSPCRNDFNTQPDANAK